jgi:hypothetical protein
MIMYVVDLLVSLWPPYLEKTQKLGDNKSTHWDPRKVDPSDV